MSVSSIMSPSTSLPSQDKILAAFTDQKVPVGRELLWKALQHGIVSEANSAEVVALLSGLIAAVATGKGGAGLEEHIADAFWLVNASLAEDGNSNNSKAEAEAAVAALSPASKGTTVVEDFSCGSPPPASVVAPLTPAPNSSNNKPSTYNGRDGIVRILQGLLGADEGDENEAIAKFKHSLMVQLQRNLEPMIMEDSGLVSSVNLLMKKTKLENTKSFRQTKFILLQEESEGFAKVLDALVRRNYGSLKSIIGTFHVDPNRVLDLALDVMIEQSSSIGLDENLEWLKEFSTDKIPALIAFKLLHTTDSAPNTQKILQTIASLAIRDPTILSLSKMSAYLEPINSLLIQTFPLYTQIERKRIKNVGRVRLGGSTAAQQLEEQRDAEQNAKLNALVRQLERSHRIQLLKMLLKRRQWQLVQVLFPNQEELNQIMTLVGGLGLEVCDWVQEQLSPLFEQYCPSPSGLSHGSTAAHQEAADRKDASEGSATTADQLVELVSRPLLCILDSKTGIILRPALLCQLCRLLRALLVKKHSSEEGSITVTSTLYTFIQSFVLPALSLFKANPSLSMEVWSILQLFPYTTRYMLYRDWRGVGLEKAGLQPFGNKKKPLVLVEKEMEAGQKARYFLRRLSKDNIRESCRSLAKVTHSNPLVMFTTVLNQIESYDNLVSVIIEALRFVTPLGLDVLGFCMLSRLCGSANNEGDRSRSKGMTNMTCRRQGRNFPYSDAIHIFYDDFPRQYTIL